MFLPSRRAWGAHFVHALVTAVKSRVVCESRTEIDWVCQRLWRNEPNSHPAFRIHPPEGERVVSDPAATAVGVENPRAVT